MLTKEQLLALDNAALIMKAAEDGLQVFPEDLLINYAEIDLTLNTLEKTFAESVSVRMLEILLQYVKDLQEDPKKTGEESGLAAAFSSLFMQYVRDVWDYGQGTADQEVRQLETFADTSDLTNNDAFEWYQLYSKALGKHQEKAVFHYMQPIILEHLDAGTVRTGLTDDLAGAFAQYGPVRAAIIARTESNKAFNWGRRYRFDKSPAIAGYRYSAILDERTTELCRFLHGHSWKIDDPELDAVTPCNHYQCRSILVPISRYVSHEWKAPAAGWEDQLPEKEKEIFERFKDSTFYPKAETVKTGKTPQMAAPKKQAAPAPAPKKKKKAADSPRDLDDFREADTIQEVQKYFKDHYDYELKGFEVNHDLEVVIGIAERIQAVFDKYPEMKGFAKVTKTTKDGKNANGYVYLGTGTIHLPDDRWDKKHFHELVKSKEKSRRVKWSVPGDGMSEYSTVTHEFGHVVHNFLNKEDWWKYVKTSEYDVEKYIKKKVLSKTKLKAGDVQRELSEYATVNVREFFAEAFSEYIDGEDPRRIAVTFGEILDGIFEAMRKGGAF